MMPDPTIINIIQRQTARQFAEPPRPLRRPQSEREQPRIPQVGASRRFVARALRAIAQRIEPAPPARATT